MGIISSGYYQVPNKVVGTLNINNDIVYVPTMSSNVDVNFGTMALSNSIPVASTTEYGGFKLAIDIGQTGSGTISETGKTYAVQLSTENVDNVAYVHVPWKNSIYAADRVQGCLCANTIQDETKDDGGYVEFGISAHSITEDQLSVASFGDMVFAEYPHAWYQNVLSDITNPILLSLDTEIDNRTEQMHEHEVANQTAFDKVEQEFKELCDAISIDYYDCTETSSKEEISAALSGLSDCIVDYYENPNLNPAYLQYETSSAVELANEFDTKQDNLNVVDTINKTYTYTQKDIPDVSSIVKYVNQELTSFEATYLGHYNSWSEVPATKTSYSKVPDKNDYIYAVIKAGDGSGITEYGTCKFKMANDTWDDTLGRNNWEFEIRINEEPMTGDQLSAINSGITKPLVDLIKSNKSAIDSLSSYLASLIGNCKKEKWIFELQDSSTVEKTMLVQ